MKKIMLLLVGYVPVSLFAQSVAINNDASVPHPSAILDIKSELKGLLTPRMTTLQRTSIAGPAIGLTVFDTETFSYWIYRGDINGGWAELQHNYQNYWDASGSNIYSKNNGNVGIGTNNPNEKLTINAVDPSISLWNAGSAKGFLQASGNNMKLGTFFNNTTGNLVFNTRATDRMWIDENGLVGIGTSSPSSALTINGTNPWIEMRNNNVDKGFLQANGNDLKLGTNSTNTTGNLVLQTRLVDRMLIDENGNIGVGTNTPSSVLTVNDTDPIIQLRNGDVDKGFIQLVSNDMKVGTNISNTYGRFMIRTGGADRLTVNYDGRVGIGTSFPYAPLTINAATPKIDFSISDIRYGHIGIEGANEDFVMQRDNYANGKIIIKNGNGWGIHLHDNGHFNYGYGLNPAGYTFSVTSPVLAPDFVSLAVANWPDYVFANTYKLKSLADLKKFIEENNHLPGIPAAAEMEKNGIQLGDMSKKLMEKVEELTLYIIQLQEQIDALKKSR